MFKSSSGSYAEYATVDETFAFPLPINTGFAEGAALGIPYFTAYRSIVHKSHAKPGEIMLVHGASGGVRKILISNIIKMCFVFPRKNSNVIIFGW